MFDGSFMDTRLITEHKLAVEDHGKDILVRYMKICQERHIKHCKSFCLKAGNPKDEAVKFAEENNTDMIFVGQRGLSTVKKIFVGSFSSFVLSHAHCDVYLVK
eukprot:c5126_g1_i1.p1 GENE.c5126_g1_i1~~c5126_g1_i1.p1  ORF type:complete len:103 (-),score=21.48 c5126_g1_i1:12-320(-)